MEKIKKIRELFISSDEHASRTAGLLQLALDELAQQHNGTMVGQKQHTDYQALFQSSCFPHQMCEETEVLRAVLELYQGVGRWGTSADAVKRYTGTDPYFHRGCGPLQHAITKIRFGIIMV